MDDPLPHDIGDPGPYLPAPEPLIWPWLLAALLLAIAIIFFLLRKKSPLTDNQKFASPYEEAQAKLHELKNTATHHTLADCASGTSLIARHYLTQSYGEPFLYETSEELRLRPSALATLPDSLSQKIMALFQSLTEAKYTPSAPAPDDASRLIQQTLDCLQQIESSRSPS